MRSGVGPAHFHICQGPNDDNPAGARVPALRTHNIEVKGTSCGITGIVTNCRTLGRLLDLIMTQFPNS